MKERESHHKGPEEREVDNLCGRYRVSTLPFSRVKFMSLRHFSTAHPFHCSSLNFKKVDLGLVYFFASWFHLFRKENWCNPNMNNHLNCYQLLQACIFHQIFQIRVISLRVGMRGVKWLGTATCASRRRSTEGKKTDWTSKVKGNELEGLQIWGLIEPPRPAGLSGDGNYSNTRMKGRKWFRRVQTEGRVKRERRNPATLVEDEHNFRTCS